jgi:transposase
MPQALLPLIPDGCTQLNALISVEQGEKEWTYFCGIQPVFRHPRNDRKSFQMFTAQLCCQGVCKQVEICRVFGVSKKSVLRSVGKYRKEGIAGFFRPAKKKGGRCLLNAEVKMRAQQLLDEGRSRRETAEQLGLKYDTLRKAINQGRLLERPEKKKTELRSARSRTKLP